MRRSALLLSPTAGWVASGVADSKVSTAIVQKKGRRQKSPAPFQFATSNLLAGFARSLHRMTLLLTFESTDPRCQPTVLDIETRTTASFLVLERRLLLIAGRVVTVCRIDHVVAVSVRLLFPSATASLSFASLCVER